MSIRAALLAAVLTGTAPPAGADALSDFRKPELRTGTLEAHPYIRLSRSYDTNVLLERRGRSSWIHALTGGLRSGWAPSEAHRLDLDYGLGYERYSRDPQANSALEHGGELRYAYAGPRLTGRLRQAYVNTVDPPNSEQTARLRRWRSELRGELDYAPEGGLLFAGVEGGHARHQYLGGSPALRALQDRYELRAGARAGVRPRPDARVYAAYRRGSVHYAAGGGRSHGSHTGVLGLEGLLSPKLAGRVEAGATARRYEQAPADARETVMSAALLYRAAQRSELELSARRALEESVFAGNRYYIAAGGSLRARHRLPGGLTVGGLALLERGDYPAPAPIAGALRRRRDELYHGRLSLEYPFNEWLKAELSHDYRARFSRDASEQFNYRQQITAAALELSL